MEKVSGIIYTPVKKEEIEERIINTKKENIEEHFLVTMYSLKAYVQSLFKFGARSDATKDALRVRKEFIRILKEENSLFRFMLKNLDIMNLEAASDLIDKLDDLNSTTVLYYYGVLDDIEEAVELDSETRAKRMPRHFETLTETNAYRKQVMALAENSKSIKEFLGYPEEFWQFIKGKYHTIDMSHEVADGMPFVATIQDNDGNISDIRMVCPEPTDLYTALIAIQNYVKAYEIYKAIGTKAKDFKYDDKVAEDIKLKYSQNLNAKASKNL